MDACERGGSGTRQGMEGGEEWGAGRNGDGWLWRGRSPGAGNYGQRAVGVGDAFLSPRSWHRLKPVLPPSLGWELAWFFNVRWGLQDFFPLGNILPELVFLFAYALHLQWMMEQLWALFSAFVVWHGICAALRCFPEQHLFCLTRHLPCRGGKRRQASHAQSSGAGGKMRTSELAQMERLWTESLGKAVMRMSSTIPSELLFRRASNWDVWGSSNLSEKLFLFKD